MFPFIYKGETHQRCTKRGSWMGAWCSTIVDRNGKYINDKWGRCNDPDEVDCC